jgi:hypothetical protein
MWDMGRKRISATIKPVKTVITEANMDGCPHLWYLQ